MEQGPDLKKKVSRTENGIIESLAGLKPVEMVVHLKRRLTRRLSRLKVDLERLMNRTETNWKYKFL